MEINRDNYESFFLSYLDGELTQSDNAAVEKFLSENTDLQKEYADLKSLRLIPDEIYFDDKQLLLRTEEKRRVSPVYWLRVAAVLMLGIAGTWLIRNSRDPISNDHVTIENHQPVAIVSSKEQSIAENKKVKQTIIPEKNEKQEAKKKQEIGKVYSSKAEPPLVESTESDAGIQKTTINMQPETAMPNPVIDTRGMSAPEMKMSPLVAISATVPENNSNATSIVSESSDQSEDVSISVLSVSGKNKPVTGFFKKLLNNKSSDKSGRTVNVSVLKISY